MVPKTFSCSVLHPVEHVNSPSLAKAHPLRKSKWINIDHIPAARVHPSFLLPSVHCECSLWPSTFNGWQDFIIFPFLSSPLLRLSNKYTFPQNVYLWILEIFLEWFVVILGNLWVSWSQWCEKPGCVKLVSDVVSCSGGSPRPSVCIWFWSSHLWPLHQAELESLEF